MLECVQVLRTLLLSMAIGHTSYLSQSPWKLHSWGSFFFCLGVQEESASAFFLGGYFFSQLHRVCHRLDICFCPQSPRLDQRHCLHWISPQAGCRTHWPFCAPHPSSQLSQEVMLQGGFGPKSRCLPVIKFFLVTSIYFHNWSQYLQVNGLVEHLRANDTQASCCQKSPIGKW